MNVKANAVCVEITIVPTFGSDGIARHEVVVVVVVVFVIAGSGGSGR